MKIHKALSIAGSDPSGGAGIQADLKTFEEYGVFGFSSLTSIVTMDPTTGWSHEVTELPETLLEKQLILIMNLKLKYSSMKQVYQGVY